MVFAKKIVKQSRLKLYREILKGCHEGILKIIQILDLCLNFWKGTVHVFDQFGHCLANSATVESGTVGVNIWSFAC